MIGRGERTVERRSTRRNINGSVYPVSVLPSGWEEGGVEGGGHGTRGPWDCGASPLIESERFVFLVIHDSPVEG